MFLHFPRGSFVTLFTLARVGALAVVGRLSYGVFPLSLLFNVNVGVFFTHWRCPSFPTCLLYRHVLNTSSVFNGGSVVAGTLAPPIGGLPCYGWPGVGVARHRAMSEVAVDP